MFSLIIDAFLEDEEECLEELFNNGDIDNLDDMREVERLIAKEEDNCLYVLRKAIKEGDYLAIPACVYDLCKFCDTRLRSQCNDFPVISNYDNNSNRHKIGIKKQTQSLQRPLNPAIISILSNPLGDPIQDYYGGDGEAAYENNYEGYEKKDHLIKNAIIEGIKRADADYKLDKKIHTILETLEGAKKQGASRKLAKKLERLMEKNNWLNCSELADEINDLDELYEDTDEELINALRKLIGRLPANPSQKQLIVAAAQCLQIKIRYHSEDEAIFEKTSAVLEQLKLEPRMAHRFG